MATQQSEISLFKVILLTDLIFIVGGFFQIFLELTLPVGDREQSIVFIFLAI